VYPLDSQINKDPALPLAQPETKPEPPHIYKAMVSVGAELSKIGISKDRRNDQQHFAFRGIDDAMNVVSPIFAKYGVVFIPHYHDYPDVERVTGKGATLIYSKVRGEFTFISSTDGSYVTTTTFGVAMDSGDKAMNKAMSAALKYALLQTFLVPTQATEDADATTPEPSLPKPGAGFDEWFTDIRAVADEGWEAMQAAWRESPADFRRYVKAYREAEWDTAKVRAQEVTKTMKLAEAGAR